jgi:hypothetical protein
MIAAHGPFRVPFGPIRPSTSCTPALRLLLGAGRPGSEPQEWAANLISLPWEGLYSVPAESTAAPL